MFAVGFQRPKILRRLGVAVLLAAAFSCSRGQIPPVYGAEKSTAAPPSKKISVADRSKGESGKPAAKPADLSRALELARESLAKLEDVEDYQCTFIKREMLGDELSEHEYLTLKVRHKPFSVYLHCQGPTMPKGQEVIYVEGRNDGDAWVHSTGIQAILGDMKLAPTGVLMMKDNRYPLTNIGMKNLITRQIAAYEKKKSPEDYQVKVLKCTIDKKECRCVRVQYPHPTEENPQLTTKTYYEKATSLPLRFERFDMPQEPDGEPVLVEEYTYHDLEINPGLTDDDFDPANPAYEFKAGD